MEWRLTAREAEVLAAMAAGKTNSAIADFLFISRKAVEKHVNSIFNKLLLTGDQQRHPRVQAVLIYLAQREQELDQSIVKKRASLTSATHRQPRHESVQSENSGGARSGTLPAYRQERTFCRVPRRGAAA